MNTQTEYPYLSPEEYLDLDSLSPFRHEYQRGLVYLMANTNKSHAQISGNLHVLLAIYLANSPCDVYMANMKVRIQTADCFYYPDVSVTCDKRDLVTDEDFILYPRLIVEVLSKCTERFDRTEKFSDYQQLPSLQEYVLISQDKIQIECFRKQELGQWESQCYGVGDVVEIASTNFRCPIEKIYNKVLGIATFL